MAKMKKYKPIWPAREARAELGVEGGISERGRGGACTEMERENRSHSPKFFGGEGD